jgi:hypothetical protein
MNVTKYYEPITKHIKQKIDIEHTDFVIYFIRS